LQDILHLLLEQSSIPVQLKIAMVIPIFKSSDCTEWDNFLLTVVTLLKKILEKVLSNCVTPFFETNKLHSPFQFGFH
jgi:hypothetical protein